MRHLVVATALVSLACSESDPSDKSSEPPVTTQPGRLLTESITVRDIPVGGEDSVCVYKQLSNDTPLKIVEVRGFISQGSHHMIVDRTRTAIVNDVPTPCADLPGNDVTRLMIAQQRETRFALPEGVAFTLEPRQFLTLEMHYVNTTSEPITADGRVELVVAPDDRAGSMLEAQMEFTGNPLIVLQPHSTDTIQHFKALPGTPSDPTYVFALTSHTHQLGVHATIERAASLGATTGELLHESTDWHEPPLDRFEPALVFDGSSGVRLTCDFNNTTDGVVTFGTRFDEEMCFMWIYFYPAVGVWR